MRALRKSRLKKNVAQVYGPHLEESNFWTSGMETAARWKPWKRTACFPQFPQPLRLDIVLEKKKQWPSRRIKQNRVDKMQSKA